MTFSGLARPDWRQVLVAADAPLGRSRWPAEISRMVAPQQVAIWHSVSQQDMLSRVEAGGVDLAVLWSDTMSLSGLRLLELVRTLTSDLPCLLVTPDTGAATLRRALALEAYSVLHQPVDAQMLAGLLVRILQRRLG